ncbi:DUF3703 domain-containing protein [Nonomuraea africana]|uniref:DUF3703 domain-containing protein n=1 Tax=Nonomuraea africana TaxID=46171 RepID=UPI00340C5806
MIGRRMPARVRAAYKSEMAAARATADPEARWRHLERAHIISQPWPWPHTRHHIAMFALAVAQPPPRTSSTPCPDPPAVQSARKVRSPFLHHAA